MKKSFKLINEYFQQQRREIAADNWRLLRQLSWCYLAFLLCYYLLVCLEQQVAAQSTAFLAAIGVQLAFSVAVFCLPRQRVGPWLSDVFLLFFGLSICALCAYVGVYVFSDSTALLFPLALIMMVQFYTLPPAAALSLLLLAGGGFLYCSAGYKSWAVFRLDLLSATVALTIALVSYYTSTKAKAEKAQQRNELDHVLRHDELTGLLNRSAFCQLYLERMKAGLEDHVLAVVNMDGFRQVNDKHGYAAGNTVLRGVAQALEDSFANRGSERCLVRLGGDEFLIFLPQSPPSEALIASFNSFFNRVADLGRQFDYSATCSVGVLRAQGRQELDSLLAQANIALTQAKQQGGCTYVLRSM